MLTVYRRDTSDSLQEVFRESGETDQNFDHVPPGGSHAGMDDPDFVAMHPHRRVPTLKDGDTVASKSDAIFRHVAAKYSNGTLWPVDMSERSRADQWMARTLAHLDDDSNLLSLLTGRTSVEARDSERIERVQERLSTRFRVLDEHPLAHEYVAGERLTMGGAPPGATLYRYFNLPVERATLPHLERCYALLFARGPHRETVMVSFKDSEAVWRFEGSRRIVGARSRPVPDSYA